MIMIQFLMTEEYAENGKRKIGRRKEETVRSKKGRKKAKKQKERHGSGKKATGRRS